MTRQEELSSAAEKAASDLMALAEHVIVLAGALDGDGTIYAMKDKGSVFSNIGIATMYLRNVKDDIAEHLDPEAE